MLSESFFGVFCEDYRLGSDWSLSLYLFSSVWSFTSQDESISVHQPSSILITFWVLLPRLALGLKGQGSRLASTSQITWARVHAPPRPASSFLF